MDGYLHTTNENLLTNCRFQGTAKGCGNQLKLNRIGTGPVIQVTHIEPCSDDLIRIESSPGNDVFRIKANGEILINGVIYSSDSGRDYNPVNNIDADNESLVYKNRNGDLIGNTGDLRWNGVGLGVGLAVDPLSKLDVNGNVMVRGNLQFDADNTYTTLSKSACVLDIEQGEDTDGIFLGKPDVDGCWKLHVSANGSLMIQKRVAGEWITRQCLE